MVVAWLILTVVGLWSLRQRSLPEPARAIWAALIVLVPLAGTLARLIVRPGGTQ